MLDNVYIISLYYREGFFPCFQILCCIQKNPSRLISKQLGKKDFSGELIRLNAGARGEHLTSQLTWAAA